MGDEPGERPCRYLIRVERDLNLTEIECRPKDLGDHFFASTIRENYEMLTRGGDRIIEMWVKRYGTMRWISLSVRRVAAGLIESKKNKRKE